MSKFQEVFPNDLAGILPEREIYFGIDWQQEMNPISNTPYRMALAESEDLKAQHYYLLEKVFIRPLISP